MALPSFKPFSSSPFPLLRRRRQNRPGFADRFNHFLYLLKNRKRDALFYLVGPLGIGKVLYMTYQLLFTYTTILLPMIMREFARSRLKWIVLFLHLLLETYLLVQIFFNYYCCIVQKHDGPHHNAVVWEVARVTNFDYPATKDTLAAHQQRVEERLSSVRDGDDYKRKKPPAWLVLEPFEWGYCSKTNLPKPPRCHYNHVIRTPVLNFDHYCPWVWNAVGYFNYRYFLTFLFSVFTMMVYKGLLLIGPYYNLNTNAYRDQRELQRNAIRFGIEFTRFPGMIPLPSERKAIRESAMVCLVLICAMVYLGGLHAYLTSTGQTTLELKSRLSCCCRKRQYHRKNVRPYSFDRIGDNWKRVFGNNWVMSLLIPNTSPPQYLPFPVPGHHGMRESLIEFERSKNKLPDL